MARRIVITSGKGGVGKTTIAVNLSAQLAKKGHRVALCDADFGVNNVDVSAGVEGLVTYDIVDVIEGRCRAKQALVRHPQYANLFILPSSHSAPERYVSPQAVKVVLDGIAPLFDFIIIDCPPSLGMLTVNALTAADGVIIPMQCEYFALEGLSQMLMTIKQIKKLYNSALTLTGILITMYNGRLNLSIQVMDELKKHYEDKVFSVTIPRSVRLSEAPSYGAPIHYYDKKNKGAINYGKIAKEIIDRT